MNQATAPLADLDVPGDYTLTLFLDVDRQDDSDQTPPLRGQYCIEASRTDGRWRLRTLPWTGSLTDDDVTGAPVVDLQNQTAGTDPLTLLRALLTGGRA